MCNLSVVNATMFTFHGRSDCLGKMNGIGSEKKTVCSMQYRYNNSEYNKYNKYPIEGHKVYDYLP